MDQMCISVVQESLQYKLRELLKGFQHDVNTLPVICMRILYFIQVIGRGLTTTQGELE